MRGLADILRGGREDAAEDQIRAHSRIGLAYPPVAVRSTDASQLTRQAAVASGRDLSLDMRRGLATVLARLGRLGEALAEYDRVLTVNPDDSLAARNRAIVLVRLFRGQEAIATLETLAAERRPEKSVLAAYGDALMHSGRDTEAVHLYETGLRRWRNDPTFLERLGSVGDFHGAGERWSHRLRRLSERGDDFRAQVTYLEALIDRGAGEEALALADALLAKPRNRTDTRIWMARAWACRLVGQSDEAHRSATEALALTPRDPALMTSVAWFLCQIGQIDEATELAERACDLSPADVRARVLCGLIFESDGKLLEALRYLDLAIALDPRSPYLRAVKASTLHRAGRNSEALQEVDAGLSLEPLDWGLLNRKAMILVDLGDPNGSVRICEQVLRGDPNNSEIMATRSIAEHVLGNDAEALAWSERALALRPNASRSHFVRAEALLALGRLQEAVAAYDQSMKASPSASTQRRRDAAAARLTGDAVSPAGNPGHSPG